ncbi:MAG: hypothetical protein AB1483_05035 [Candidatus Zixiibacteriota bacterium]
MPRVIYQDWIVQLGYDPQRGPAWFRADRSMLDKDDGADDDSRPCVVAVRQALGSLSEAERELVIRVDFMGESIAEIARRSGRSIFKLRGMHRRTLRAIKKRLTRFVAQRYDIRPTPHPSCPICASPFRGEIDAVIAGRDRGRNWSPVIAELKLRYSIKIVSPQLLIGHEKYHR